MEHPEFHKALAKAGLATIAGGVRRSANNSMRSRRQRVKAFTKEAHKRLAAFAKVRPGFVFPENDAEINRMCLDDMAFAALNRDMEDLRDKWGL